MASSENGINGDDLRERGDPTGTAGPLYRHGSGIEKGKVPR